MINLNTDMLPSPKDVKTSITWITVQPSLNDTSKEENAVTAFLHGQDVGGVGQLALLCGRNSLSVTQRSVAVWVPKRRVVLPVAQPGEGETQQRPHQHICIKETHNNTDKNFY